MRVALLIALCVLAYAPSLTIPLLEDDYPHISMSRHYGSWEGLKPMLSDSTFRLRATSWWAMGAIWPHAGVRPLPYRMASLLLHILAALLLYGLASRWAPVKEGAFWAAAFFAVHEGHQEAVMWFSAINELLVFVFGLGALLCWRRAAGSAWWHVPGVLLFALALLSKETAFVLLPLLPLVRWKPGLALAPYGALTLLAALSVAHSMTASFRFGDGSFSLSAPFWITFPRGLFRLLWIWGVLALAVWWVRRLPAPPLRAAFVWMGVALLPYSFLTYSTEIPSRQVYLASAGLALLVGCAYARLPAWAGARIAAAVALAVVAHNTATLWTKKHRQFTERAAPTERLLEQVRSTPGPIVVRCFPRQRLIAEEAVRLAAPDALPRLVWDGAPCPER
jgi:hypothetical protein